MNCRFSLSRRLIVLAWLSCCSWVAVSSVTRSNAAERDASYHAAIESIRTDQLQTHVEYLADEKLQGRKAGTRGGRMAADYVARALADLPLRGAGIDGGFFQPFSRGCRNVLALLPGSDPEQSREVVLIAAHYDHLGFGGRASRGPTGKLHPGADDNASGTAALLELAEAFTLLAQPPKRSVLFIAFDMEERGLVGSKHWTAHPTVPLDRVAVMLNMDMLGRLRDDRLTVFGWRSAYGLRRFVAERNGPSDLTLHFPFEIKRNGDHCSFSDRGIPILFLHTGLHDDYHTPRDRIELVNTPGITRVTRLMFAVAHDLAEAPKRPEFRDVGGRENATTERQLLRPKETLPGKPLRLGITWRVDEADPGALVLIGVAADSPAGKVDLQPGDRICRIDGQDFADEGRFIQLANSLSAPLVLQVERDGRLHTVELHVAPVESKKAA